jgi:hypothetical protein
MSDRLAVILPFYFSDISRAITMPLLKQDCMSDVHDRYMKREINFTVFWNSKKVQSL